jgi:hypothetical protein
MRAFKLLTAMLLVLISSTSASAVVILRTPPFPGYFMVDGQAHCAVSNGGTLAGTATIVLYDQYGTSLTSSTLSVGVNATRYGGARSLDTTSPTMCECTVPTSTNFRCAFVYLDFAVEGTRVIVIEAK